MADEEAVALKSINAELTRMVAAEVEPYEAAYAVQGAASGAFDVSDVAVSLYLIWAALTDRVELRPEEEAEANAAMLRAAAEWLELDDDAAREKYIDRWLHEECGYPRPVVFEGSLLVMQRASTGRDLSIRVSDDEGVTLFDSEAPDAPRIHMLSVVGLDGYHVTDKERLAIRGKKRSLVWSAFRVRIVHDDVVIWAVGQPPNKRIKLMRF